MRQNINTWFHIGGWGLDRTDDFKKFCGSRLDRIQFYRIRTGLGLKNFTVRSSLVQRCHQCCQPCVFPANLGLFFCGVAFFFKTCGLLLFGLVLIEICCFLGLFFADCFFPNFLATLLFQFTAKGILGMFLWKFAHFGLVFRICHPVFLFDFLADFWIFLPTHFGLVFHSNYLFWLVSQISLLVFVK